ncbi:DUF4190 domain-containing protein [Flavimobilis sp. GY10621]|uniref:DUF4190 domain-containing protein n=2 Tax=Flavimobilis rhizosphaerae TaxID=2775421 RepID=A0ABR9DP20_9MICO|nr:DUF4190 domain-containing protein [Flavimobilis rhizosphaerae]
MVQSQRAARSARRAQVAHQARVVQVEQWEAAYREVHGGQAPPPGALPPGAASVLSPARTNVAAILSLVFGLGGGLLGIVFGHVALKQIAETGERGRGLAVAGLVLGYLGLLIIVAVVVGLLVLAG